MKAKDAHSDVVVRLGTHLQEARSSLQSLIDTHEARASFAVAAEILTEPGRRHPSALSRHARIPQHRPPRRFENEVGRPHHPSRIARATIQVPCMAAKHGPTSQHGDG